MSSAVRAVRIHAFGLPAATAAEAGPEGADAGAVLLQRPAVGRTQRVLEQRVGVHREDDAALHLELGGSGLLDAEEGGGGRALGLARPLQPGPGGVPARQGAGVHGLGARDQHDVALAPADAETGVVHQGLGVVAADGRDHELGGLVAVGETETGRHQAGGVRHRPAQRRHHPDAVGVSDESVPGRGRAALRGAVAVLGGGAQRRRHERQRLGPGRGVEPGVGRRGNLAHADHHGGSRVERHGPRSVPVHAPGALRCAVRLDSHAWRRRLGSRPARSLGEPEVGSRPPQLFRRDPMSSDETALAADPEVAHLLGEELQPAADDPAADRLGELHVAGRARRVRLGADEQILRGLPRPPLLRGQPGHRRGGGPGP